MQIMVSEKKYKTKNDNGRICKKNFFVKIAGKPEYRWRIIIILLDGVRRYEGKKMSDRNHLLPRGSADVSIALRSLQSSSSSFSHQSKGWLCTITLLFKLFHTRSLLQFYRYKRPKIVIPHYRDVLLLTKREQQLCFSTKLIIRKNKLKLCTCRYNKYNIENNFVNNFALKCNRIN